MFSAKITGSQEMETEAEDQPNKGKAMFWLSSEVCLWKCVVIIMAFAISANLSALSCQ